MQSEVAGRDLNFQERFYVLSPSAHFPQLLDGSGYQTAISAPCKPRDAEIPELPTGLGTCMAQDKNNTSQTRSIQLTDVEISRFRRFGSVKVAVDPQTTVIVGANNSGKTSILTAIRKFLATSAAFSAFDLSVDQWPILRQMGAQWEKMDDPDAECGDLDWGDQLQKFLACMPALDLWFDVQAGGFHIVRPFLPSLQWSGGPIGVRIRLEPVASIEELQELAWRFCKAREPVRTHVSAKRAWPMDILDYWLRYPRDLGRTAVYKLDPVKRIQADNSLQVPQDLPSGARPLDRSTLTPLIRVDFVPAQRGLGMEEAEGRHSADPHRAGLFSNQVLQFARHAFDVSRSNPCHHPDLIAAVENAQNELDLKIQTALEPTIEDVKKLGYPGLHDPQSIHFRTRINLGSLLDHSTAIQYRLDGQPHETFFPEHTIGLGYQNLQSLSYLLVSFRQSRLDPLEGMPAAVHLVLLEEPEAHLHIQVQRIFAKRALELITPLEDSHAHLASQLILSTHASHLAHSEPFTRLRYVRRIRPSSTSRMAGSEVVNLADVFGSDIKTRTFAERYFQVQHTDLLFADAAIFVEGTAERMLVPFFIERDFKSLRNRYLSFLEVGGSHAHRLRPLVEHLGIPIVVITDIDPVKETLVQKTGQKVRKAHFVDDPSDLESGNPTLKNWHPKKVALTDFSSLSGDDLVCTNEIGGRVRFAWQIPMKESGAWPSSFEDSIILHNQRWFRSLSDESGALKSVMSVAKKHSCPLELNRALHDLLRGSLNKGDFASTIFEKLSLDNKIDCPEYITDALEWLEKELNLVEPL